MPLRAVATLKQWDAGDAPSRFREQPSPEHCEASWTAPRTLSDARDTTPVYVYVRDADA